ncbi:SRPBCC domain-containing protein [uncultured Sulfitobacter sp.]|uniref:SRPBCC domain-containing protein n=1 Tax=uncultured Sulfitobacter sp. TaxID=191468 RepID=UPI002618A779|nr:SRPBCC domain-containing protein [uncultured Sulfitobacter sp.]
MTPAPKSIQRTFIEAPIETVWATLVATDKPLPFFFGAVCDTTDGLKPGAKMRMVHPNGKIAMVVGEVLTFEPPHRYAHTFQMTNIDEPPCVVTYELVEKDGGTEFSLIIGDAVAGSKLHKEMVGAQGYIAKNIKAVAETGKPAFSGRMVTLMSPVIALMSKSKQRIEHWPL